MKVVISPAKLLDFSKKIPTTQYTQPLFIEEATQVNAKLKELTPKDLADLMHISDKLADLNWQRNQEFNLPFTYQNSRPAVFTFDGQVYEGLDAYSLNNEEITKLQQNLRILSGQYGILKPLDLIQAYRLEMGSNLGVNGTENLYEYWQNKITDFLNSELSDNELFVNLASNEYFGAVNTKKLKVPVITPTFKDWKDNKLKTIVFYTKRARGLMVRYIVKNNVQSVEELKGFNYEGYTFSHELSKKNNLVFIR